MRDRTEIEREMFEARLGLESNIDQLIHKAREQLAFKERAKHVVEEKVANTHPAVIALAVVGALTILYLVIRKREP